MVVPQIHQVGKLLSILTVTLSVQAILNVPLLVPSSPRIIHLWNIVKEISSWLQMARICNIPRESTTLGGFPPVWERTKCNILQFNCLWFDSEDMQLISHFEGAEIASKEAQWSIESKSVGQFLFLLFSVIYLNAGEGRTMYQYPMQVKCNIIIHDCPLGSRGPADRPLETAREDHSRKTYPHVRNQATIIN